jgi:hypothetical protein
MSIAGVILIIWAVKRDYAGVKPLAMSALANGLNMDVRKATRIRRLILRVLLILPLFIPSDWTQDIPVRYGERHAGMVHSELYPEIVTNLKNEEF